MKGTICGVLQYQQEKLTKHKESVVGTTLLKRLTSLIAGRLGKWWVFFRPTNRCEFEGHQSFALRWTHFLKFFVVLRCIPRLPNTFHRTWGGNWIPKTYPKDLSPQQVWLEDLVSSKCFLLGTTSFAHVFLWISCESTPNATPIHANLGSVIRGIFFGTMMGFRNPDHKALLPLTTLKTNMSPKNRMVGRCIPYWNGHF